MRIAIRGEKTQSGYSLDSSSSLGNMLDKVIFDNHQNRLFVGSGLDIRLRWEFFFFWAGAVTRERLLHHTVRDSHA